MDVFYRLLTLVILIVISWVGCVGLLWLIFLCFGLDFTARIGTGIWLVIIFINTSLKLNIWKGKD